MRWLIICGILILINPGCTLTIEKQIKRAQFQTLNKSPKTVGTDKIIFFKDKFEYKNKIYVVF